MLKKNRMSQKEHGNVNKDIFIFFICLISFLLCLSQACADDSLWVNYFDNYFYDSNSVSCKDEVCTVRLMLLMKPNDRMSPNKPDVYIRDTRYSIQIDCKKKLTTNGFSVSNRLSDGTSENKQYEIEWIPIIPKSRNDKLTSIICPNGNNLSQPSFQNKILPGDSK